MDTEVVHNVVIIGGGCAGLTAGIYCARAGMMPILFANLLSDKGGLLVKTSIVENYPGYQDGILGYDLIQNMEDHAVKYGTKVIDRQIVDINHQTRPFVLTDDQGQIYKAHTIIIATGSKPNKLQLDDEERLWSKGISSCAVCDGALYRGKKIVVVGGGDSAMEEAQFLTKFSDVTLIHRRDTFRASKAMYDRVKQNPKINIIVNSAITKLHGLDCLERITITNLLTNEENEMEVDGLFYGLGLTPNTKMFQHIVQTDNDGYILTHSQLKLTPDKHTHAETDFETMTSVPGIFVAGDAHDKVYRQAIVAAGDGCKAALDVDRYLAK